MSQLPLVPGVLFLLIALALHLPALAADKPVKVFILAGQSNMQGKGGIARFDNHIKHSPKRKALLTHLKKDGEFVMRKDVWVSYPAREKKGELTVGYGSGNDRIGPELGFGHVVGEHYDEQVLIIKIAWGGKSLGRDFRPPSSGKASDEIMAAQYKKYTQRKKGPLTKETVDGFFGKFYRQMVVDVNASLANIKADFPAYNDQGYELAGFVWFQGFNDGINKQFTAEYTANMANFIRDVRKDFKAPDMPFIIGEMGHDGEEKKNAIRQAQADTAKIEEFKGNVKLVETWPFWDHDAVTIQAAWGKKYGELKREFGKNPAEMQRQTKAWMKETDFQAKALHGDKGYHYMGSFYTFNAIGDAFGKAMLDFEKKK